MRDVLDTLDLVPFAAIDPAKADAMVTHANAQARMAAPCLKDTTDPDLIAAAKAILVGVVLRWHESGTGSYQAAAAGPPGTQPRAERRNMLWPSEVKDLRALCKSASGAGRGGAFSVSLTPVYVVPDV